MKLRFLVLAFGLLLAGGAVCQTAETAPAAAATEPESFTDAEKIEFYEAVYQQRDAEAAMSELRETMRERLNEELSKANERRTAAAEKVKSLLARKKANADFELDSKLNWKRRPAAAAAPAKPADSGAGNSSSKQ